MARGASSDFHPPNEGSDTAVESRQEAPNWDSDLFRASEVNSSADTDNTTSETETLAGDATDSVLNGDTEGLEESIESAFEGASGNPDEFKQFGQKLQESLADQGYEVSYGDKTVSLRREGADTGLRFNVDGELDFASGKIKGDATAEVIDWKTGEKVDGKPEDVLGKAEGESAGADEGGSEAEEGDTEGDQNGDKIDSLEEIQKLFPGDNPAEGGGKFNPAPTLERPFDADQSVSSVEDALKGGSFQGLKDSIRQAYEDANGDPAKFQQFGQKLQESLADQGYDVRFGEDSIALHRQGSETGVEFKLSGEHSVGTNEITGEVATQTYDWDSKVNVDKNPETALNESGEGSTETIVASNDDSYNPPIFEGGGKARPPFERPGFGLDRPINLAEAAVTNGDMHSLTSTIEETFAGVNGDLGRFQEFGEKLQDRLRDSGIDVNYGENAIAFHRQGSDTAVQFSMDGDFNVASNSMEGKLSATPYDWNSKEDLNIDPESALGDLQNLAQNLAGMSPSELASLGYVRHPQFGIVRSNSPLLQEIA